MTKDSIQPAIIEGFRNLIRERYHYENLVRQYHLPPKFDEAQINRFKNFFLDQVYPSFKKRKELEVAFENLDNYIKSPDKLLRLLLDSASLVFKYGRSLPKILMAGLKALQSFRAASDFEEKLIEKALELEQNPPYDTSTMKYFLSSLPNKELDEFMQKNKSLFDILQDRKLVNKIISIVNHLIVKMEGRPQVYGITEVNALKVGRDIITQAHTLIADLDLEEQQLVVNTVLQIEEDFFQQLRRGGN